MNTNEYETTDLALAAVISLQLALLRVEKADPKRVRFVFNDSPELQHVIQLYWDRQLQVEPSIYFNQIKAMKSRIYDGSSR